MSERDLRRYNLFKEYEKIIIEINRKLGELNQRRKVLEKELTLLNLRGSNTKE